MEKAARLAFSKAAPIVALVIDFAWVIAIAVVIAIIAPLAAVAATSAPTRAAQAAGGGAGATHDDALQSFVRAQVGEHHRVEISFGELPDGTRLAPCRRIEPFLAAGARLWGNSRIGVRCLSGANWSVSLPVQVRVFGLALVTTRAIMARASVNADDVRVEEIELTRLNGRPITDATTLDGMMAMRPIAAGQPLLAYHVKLRPTIAVGDPVQVRVLGRGFTIVANGSALAPGNDGAPLRVRTDSGRVVVGTLNGQTVDLSP